MSSEHTQTFAARGLWLTCGVLGEAAAAICLTQHEDWSALALHVASSLAFGLLAAAGRPLSRRGVCFVAASLALALPVFGALGVWAVVIPAWRARRDAEVDSVVELGMPAFDDFERAPRVAPAPIELVLRSGGASHKRVASVMALRKMDAQLAVPLLRVALGDLHEDVRLLAYAILERREKDLRRRIESTLSDLEALQAPGEEAAALPRAAALHALAEQHWELVHGGFASGGELENATLESALRFGHESLLLAGDGSLALLLARIRLRQGHARAALRYLRAAQALGVANAALAPLYAEVAFLLRRFHAIAPLLSEAGQAPLARPRLAAVAAFWHDRAEA